VQELEDVSERKAVLLAQRQEDAVIRRGGLQLEVERSAEALAQRETPGPIDAAAEWRVEDELHPPGLIEEALGDDRPGAGEHSEHLPTGPEVLGQGLHVPGTKAESFQPFGRRGMLEYLVPETPHLARQLVGARGRLAPPERHARRRASRVLDPHHTAAEPLDAPARAP
jgi:hypothetical protein